MAPFDIYFPRLAQFVSDMRGKGRQFREIYCPTNSVELLSGLPVRVGRGACEGVILRSDTYLELGNPENGSCSILLWTDNPSLITDGKITLIGPDIQESKGSSLAFGQVLLLGGSSLVREDHERIEQSQFISDQIEGYMIRSIPDHIWSRVSTKAVEKGFCFETLGRALSAIIRSEIPKIQAVEIIFITSQKEDVDELEQINRQVKKISREMVKETWKAKGIDIFECNLGWDCSSCPDKPICDDIRKLTTIRKKNVTENNAVRL